MLSTAKGSSHLKHTLQGHNAPITRRVGTYVELPSTTTKSSVPARTPVWAYGASLRRDRLKSCSVSTAPVEVEDRTALQTAGVVVAGGGPAGYSVAMALAQNGFKDIVVLEQAESADFFNPTKGYVFNITKAGQDVLETLGIDNLRETGLSGANAITYLHLDGSNETKNTGVPGDGCWIQRHRFLMLLHNYIRDHHSDSIKVVYNTRVESLDLADPEGRGVIVNASVTFSPQPPAGEADPVRYLCRLIIAADGAKSRVVESLCASQPTEDWDMHAVSSPAAGLNIKVLPLSPCPKLSSTADRVDNRASVVIPGRSVNGDPPLRLGLLNIKDREDPRTANFVLYPDHPFWKLSTSEELFRYLEQAFPQLDLLRDNVAADDVQRFLETEPLQFSKPQTLGKLLAQFSSAQAAEVAAEDAAGGIEGCAVVVLGDAAHVFPPDLGQGVNSTLLDVYSLVGALKGNTDVNTALREYEAARLPENKALQRIMQVAFPYQYRQYDKKLQRALNVLNIGVRLLLTKLAPKVFSNSVAFASMSSQYGNPDTMYQDILRNAQATTRLLLTMLLAAVVACGVFIAKMASSGAV